jgi:hypothetical protein
MRYSNGWASTADGQPVTTTFADYLLPGATEVPGTSSAFAAS